ncbi:protein IQ-DOMAIN 31 isoform X1 [Senna tora]|uniref:Protein IQ-DOMAIN 31 isoform X1 n=1 Tax=Senna tora TaxID=362788 RepID=A0A834X543_9FABA|nr:protein IQ-DOMAIN 31 isoform X1 [Senna tora]
MMEVTVTTSCWWQLQKRHRWSFTLILLTPFVPRYSPATVAFPLPTPPPPTTPNTPPLTRPTRAPHAFPSTAPVNHHAPLRVGSRSRFKALKSNFTMLSNQKAGNTWFRSPDLVMGKSPGKWIKTVLFGKKSSKSNISKGSEKLSKQKETYVASKALETAALSLDPTPNTLAGNGVHLELENKEPEENLLPLNQETDIVGSDHQDAPLVPEKIEREEVATEDAPPDPEKTMQEEAAMKVQAALRGFMARRAFKALKGIIRLQALFRGHLVRRQAVATLCCMYGIVKLQALVCGRRVRQSDFRFDMHEKRNLVKPLDGKLVYPDGTSATKKIANLSANNFIRKLLASSTTIIVLRLEYVHGDPNSVPSWLERWSASCFWKPVPQPKKVLETKSQRKQGSTSSIGEAPMSKSKRSNRRIPSANLDSVSVQANPELEKPKRNVRKVLSHPTDPVQENPQSEFEKVKRNLRKVHNPIVENAIQSEVESETLKQQSEKASVTSGHSVSLEGVKSSNEKIKEEATLTTSDVPDLEVTPIISVSNEASEMPRNCQVPFNSEPLRENTSRDRSISGEEPISEPKDLLKSFCNDENLPLTNGHLSLQEDSAGNENQKPTQKSSFPGKQEIVEDGIGLRNSPKLPSYMAATESAKAKLRAQGSPRLAQDGGERSNNSRRHSLPSSTNSKISSHSPRMQKPGQAGGKGGHKSDKTTSSRDGNEMGALKFKEFKKCKDGKELKVDTSRVEEVISKNTGFQEFNTGR